jgi:enoyl-CoA hydratase/carnithine racemase
MLFTGITFDARQAHGVGFVDEVHEPDAFPAALDSLIAEIAANAPDAIAAMKRVIAGIEQDDPNVASLAADLERTAVTGSEHREAVGSFLARIRHPG